MAGIRLQGVWHRGQMCLDVDIDLPSQGVCGVWGGSGSGKTSLLRVLAGLDRLQSGFLSNGRQMWQDCERKIFVPSHQRDIGMVFQEASLFPHLSIRQNLSYGFERTPKIDRHISWDEVVDVLDLGTLLERRPKMLSGGESQRVAIGRTLLASPRLLLMDEPLSAIDVRRKRQILPYIKEISRKLEIPVVYVSHYQDELTQLADHLLIMQDGRIRACGDIHETPVRLELSAEIADELGAVIDVRLVGFEGDGLARLAFSGGELLIPREGVEPGTLLRCRILARDVSLALEEPKNISILNHLPATVLDYQESDRGGHVYVQLQVGSCVLVSNITRRSFVQLSLCRGQSLWALIKSAAVLGY